MKKLIIASTSTIHGSSYLEYLLPSITSFFNGVSTLLFIPYARPGGISFNEYTKQAAQVFNNIGIDVKGIHEFRNSSIAVKNAEAIFTGGGNTFELVNQLHKHNLFSILSDVINDGTPYLGTSAGSNICGVTMMNTNDMPIVYPPSFLTLGIIPFNINAHYLDPDKSSTHMGETRETRIKEYHIYNDTSVLGLREGSWLEVNDSEIILKGTHSARWFEKNKLPREILTNTKL
jgi:dipeptidase E